MIKFKPYALGLATMCFTFVGCIKDGVDGKNSLIDQIAEAPGANCPAGGYKIITGLDENRNNVLDDVEIQKTEYVCNSNKETIIYFPITGASTQSTTPLLLTSSIIRDFNIANYNADSVVFACNAYTYMGGVTSTVELYDFTNNKVINNTTINTDNDNPNWSYKTTPNFQKDLPKSPINIGLRITSGRNGGGSFSVYNPVLRLYKK